MRARPGRTAAVVGAVVAVSATTLMGFAGSASAMVPGTCTENVNVRAEPDIDSRIVALCEAGTAVTTGATRDGFVRLTDLGGWASAQYISIDGAQPASTGPAPSTATSPSTSPSTPPSTGPSTRPAPADEDETGTSAGDETPGSPTGTEPSTTEPSTSRSGTSDDEVADDEEAEDESAEDEDSPGLAGLL